MGFATTAAYFDERAKRARDANSKALFSEAAGFYRQLACIAPTFPPGFTVNKPYSKTDRFQARAEECRTMAEHFTDPNTREQMRRLADTYEQLATAAE